MNPPINHQSSQSTITHRFKYSKSLLFSTPPSSSPSLTWSPAIIFQVNCHIKILTWHQLVYEQLQEKIKWFYRFMKRYCREDLVGWMMNGVNQTDWKVLKWTAWWKEVLKGADEQLKKRGVSSESSNEDGGVKTVTNALYCTIFLGQCRPISTVNMKKYKNLQHCILT